MERRNNQEIARELGISRFRVARLIEQAIETGTVKITITPPAYVDADLSSAVRERYGLKEALVLASPAAAMDGGSVSSTDGDTMRAGVARLAGRYLSQLCRDGMKVGISWGRTLDDVAGSLESLGRLPTCDIVQLVGNLPTLEDSLHAGDVLRRFSNLFRGASYALHAPLVVQSPTAARAFRSEESVARTLAIMADVEVAVVGIGSWSPASSRLMEVLPKEDLRFAESVHPAADVCAILFDENGREVGESFRERRIGVTREGLDGIPMVVGVAAGIAKAHAVRAALSSGVLNCLVVDHDTAISLLEERPVPD